ncbi:MAG TPA: Stk1 family PASTA domain-containing Ser/Thr kinase [Clostridia bacterium]
MEGTVLGNRYELLERVGGGGMALVYKAKCNLLNRYVAVKILRQDFTNDEEFVKRFRIEAQSAASLSHPNIVSIYDVGQEGNIHYIVMEYVDGITLKDLITRFKKLDWKQSLKIAIQICSAIEHAHRNHIVHRDIKPHNILLTDNLIAKVTDFGIARAVSSSTITMVGSTIGSVHYFSPEQARGGYTDEKSDLYSLGITLYEMVTGKLPFDGDTPVAVALKHLQDEAVPPVDIDPGIPKGVNDIIMKAIRKDQSKRYHSASEMLHDLNSILSDPASFYVEDVITEDMPTKRVKTIGEAEIVKRNEPLVEKEENEEKTKDKMTVGLAIGTSVIIILIVMFVAFRFFLSGLTPNQTDDSFKMQNYVGKKYSQAEQELKSKNIQCKANYEISDKVDKGVIIKQNVDEGKPLKPGGMSVIVFEVSDGPETVKMVDLTKQDAAKATETLKDMKLTPKTIEQYDAFIVKGSVIKTDPENGEAVPVGSEVTLYVSKGPEIHTTTVPDLKGLNSMEAQKKLADSNLALGKVYPEDGKNYVDKIVKQKPEANTEVNEKSPVDIYLETTIIKRRIVTYPIPLPKNPENFGDKIKLGVEVTPSDTNKTETLLMDMKDKKDFPVTVGIPVPEGGSTKVKVLWDNEEQEFTVSP